MVLGFEDLNRDLRSLRCQAFEASIAWLTTAVVGLIRRLALRSKRTDDSAEYCLRTYSSALKMNVSCGSRSRRLESSAFIFL